MKTIAILGSVDKRIIIYPLARALSIEGSVMIAADDGAYMRLYPGTDDCGTCGKVDIAVDTKISDKLKEKLGNFGTEYDWGLIVSNHIIPSNCDYIVYCTGIDRTICPEDKIKLIGDVPFSEIVISCNIPRDRGAIAIIIRDACIRYLFDAEECKQFKVLPDREVNKTIASVFSKALDIPKDHIYKLLTRKENDWKSIK